MPDTRLADISEFQSNIDAPAYLAGGYRCLLVRAHNGYRADHLWPARRDYLRGYPFAALGFYQYLTSSRDAAQQAREFVSCVGALRDNEFVVLDLEEGNGDQVWRAEAWFRVVDSSCGFRATLYSGQSYCRDHLGGWERWRTRPRWLAAYQRDEPRDAHELWQNTDKARFPGLAGAVDGNLFHGSAERFCAVFRCADRSAPAKPASVTAALRNAQSSVCVLKHSGERELFVETASGEIWHTWDSARGWHSLGTPKR